MSDEIIDDFCAYILSYDRPDRITTYRTLRRQGYTGDICVLVGDDDPQLAAYRDKFGEELHVFDKRRWAERTDTGHPDCPKTTPVHARNAIWDVAAEQGYSHFWMLDDDYSLFQRRYDAELEYNYSAIDDLDELVRQLIRFYEATPTDLLAIAQTGDYIGGAGNENVGIKMRRKVMNTFICATDNPVEFVSAMNDDVTTYVSRGRRGRLFLSFMPFAVNQEDTQQHDGGLTDLYVETGTYTKSFQTVLWAPSCTKISEIIDKHNRIHHQINWRYAAPKILREKHQKPRSDT